MEQDKELSKKIIDHELSGVFNCVLEGLRRLLLQKGFTFSDAVDHQIENYKLLSDKVKLFLNDERFANDTVDFMEFKEFLTITELIVPMEDTMLVPKEPSLKGCETPDSLPNAGIMDWLSL